MCGVQAFSSICVEVGGVAYSVSGETLDPALGRDADK